jgi:hypothetical protein
VKKYIVAIAALVALAALIAIPFANAATTDANGVVTVSKGEIMAQFPDMNESAFQNGPKVLTGSNVFTATTTTGTGCSDGTIQYHERNTVITKPINFAPIVNAANGKTTGWTMTKGASVLSENNTYGTSPSGRFPNYATICEGHGSISAFNAVFTQTHSDVTTTTFNGSPVTITVTPYVAPAV